MITNTITAAKGNQYPNAVVDFKQDNDTLYFTTQNGVVLALTVLWDSAVRFRYATEYAFEPDFSYAIDENATFGYNELSVQEEAAEYIITTLKLKIHLSKLNLALRITDIVGTTIMEDEAGFHWEENHAYGGNTVKMSKVCHAGESYYGMGDKASHTNLKGKRVHQWVTDCYAYGKDQEPLYKAIPFYVGLKDSIAYGVFFDNSFGSYFDFANEKRNVTSFWADGGEMNYYFFYGPTMRQVVAAYTYLTGAPELPPLWALGLHQSKWSYFPERKVKEIAATFRKLQIPCDALYLDIDYMEGFRCFTWNAKHFPNPKKMIEALEADGFKVITIIDPGIKIDPNYWVYQQGMEGDFFCKRADGPPFKGKVWPGACKFPDFTQPEVREWWAGLHKELIAETGVRGVWNDMNEPAVMEVPTKTAPLDVRHHYDGHPCSHRKAHNVYGMQMVRATYHGLKKFTFPRRPFVLTRAAYAGTQRYAATWTGDNVATWEHLWIANVQMQRMCLSGYSFAGSDIGGFAEQPTGELFARWVQLAVFHPFCRIHSSGDHGEQEPWSFGEEITAIVKKYVELRYQLLPYLYTAFYKYSKNGLPMIQSLVFYDQHDVQTHYRTDEFLFGEQLLVCPVQVPNAAGRRMYFPKGNWFNYWTDEVVSGGVEKWVPAPLNVVPLYVKEGAMIPKYPVQQYVGQQQLNTLHIDVYYKEGTENSTVYEDQHEGYAYKNGQFCLRKFRLHGKANDLAIQHFKDGDFTTAYTTLTFTFHGLPFTIATVEVDNDVIDPKEIQRNGNPSIEIRKDFMELHLLGA